MSITSFILNLVRKNRLNKIRKIGVKGFDEHGKPYVEYTPKEVKLFLSGNKRREAHLS